MSTTYTEVHTTALESRAKELNIFDRISDIIRDKLSNRIRDRIRDKMSFREI